MHIDKLPAFLDMIRHTFQNSILLYTTWLVTVFPLLYEPGFSKPDEKHII
mgnify:CR=1